MKQVTLAFLSYVQDYDETYPKSYQNTFPGGAWGWGSSDITIFDTVVAPYIKMGIGDNQWEPQGKGAAVFSCPSDNVSMEANTGVATAGKVWRTYAMASTREGSWGTQPAPKEKQGLDPMPGFWIAELKAKQGEAAVTPPAAR